MDFKSSKRSRWTRVAFLSLFLSGMAASPPLVGGPAPAFKLKTVKDEVVNSANLKGQFVILNFWATWCIPCIKEMPEFQKAHIVLGSEVKIIGINLAETKEKVAAYMKDRHLSFPILLDEYGNVSQEYEVMHLPVTFFITPDGIVREKVFGGGITQKMIETKINQLH